MLRERDARKATVCTGAAGYYYNDGGECIERTYSDAGGIIKLQTLAFARKDGRESIYVG